MGSRTVKVSDLSGEIIDPSRLTRLVIEEHPDFPEPITLEVLPEEIETDLPEQEPYVLFSPTNLLDTEDHSVT